MIQELRSAVEAVSSKQHAAAVIINIYGWPGAKVCIVVVNDDARTGGGGGGGGL